MGLVHPSALCASPTIIDTIGRWYDSAIRRCVHNEALQLLPPGFDVDESLEFTTSSHNKPEERLTELGVVAAFAPQTVASGRGTCLSAFLKQFWTHLFYLHVFIYFIHISLLYL